MIDVERSIVIEKPPKDVFAYVSDLTNEPAYHTDVLASSQTSKGPAEVGTTYVMKMKPFRGIDQASARITRLEAGRAVEFVTEIGRMRATRTFLVEPVDGGTRITHRLQFPTSGMMRLMAIPMRRMVRKRWDAFLGNLKRRLEA